MEHSQTAGHSGKSKQFAKLFESHCFEKCAILDAIDDRLLIWKSIDKKVKWGQV